MPNPYQLATVPLRMVLPASWASLMMRTKTVRVRQIPVTGKSH